MSISATFTNNPIYNFDYTGTQQEFIAPYNGTYQLEVWGAEGGNRSGTASGGKGGYSCGQINLKKGDILYIYVGGNGNDGKGYNGGGQVGSTAVYGGGGTDIRKDGTELANRIIVAGGGGSVGASYNAGAYGGGTTGGSASDGYGTGGGGATQTAGGSGYSVYPASIGSLGKGGNGYYASSGYGGAGGGGYYGGGGVYPDSSVDDDRGGGGGSGYINTSVVSVASTKAGNTSIPTTGTNLTGSTIGRSGHGSCRIILVTKETTPVYINVNGTWKEAVTYINVNGTWKETTPQINVNETWKNL